MEKQEYIETVLLSARQALSTGNTDRVRYSFIVQYRNSDSLQFKSESYEAYVENDRKTWFVDIDGQSYRIGEFPEFWKQADHWYFLSERIIAKNDFNDVTLKQAKQQCIEHLINQTIHYVGDLDINYIRQQVEENVEFTVFDTTKPNIYTGNDRTFSYKEFDRAGNCGVLAEYELTKFV